MCQELDIVYRVYYVVLLLDKIDYRDCEPPVRYLLDYSLKSFDTV